jgi:hypothetical protein
MDASAVETQPSSSTTLRAIDTDRLIQDVCAVAVIRSRTRTTRPRSFRRAPCVVERHRRAHAIAGPTATAARTPRTPARDAGFRALVELVVRKTPRRGSAWKRGQVARVCHLAAAGLRDGEPAEAFGNDAGCRAAS